MQTAIESAQNFIYHITASNYANDVAELGQLLGHNDAYLDTNIV